MKNSVKTNNKTRNSLLALFLIFAFAISLVTLPAATAHTPPITVKTYAFINVAPDPIGVGQQATVSFWLDKVPIGAEGPWGSRWHNLTVTVTKPDGNTETIGPFDSDVNGGAGTRYTPDQVGDYKFDFSFPGQVGQNENPYPPGLSLNLISLGLDFVNDTFLPSSASATLTVQQDPVGYEYGANPLPTSYWTRPINSMNREWSSIGGNWLGLAASSFVDTGRYDQNGNFDPYSAAPNSAHVMWTKPLAFGGQIGGSFGSSDTAIYATGTAYEGKFGGVILNGVLYYTAYPGAKNNPGPLTAVDLRTGQTLWTKDIGASSLRVGMVYNFQTGDQYGAHAYLFTAPSTFNGWTAALIPNQWQMYDAMTGAWILNIANVSAGTLVAGPNGEILSYSIANGMLSMWNSSLCIEAGSQKNNVYLIYSASEIWRPPQGATIDWKAGYQWSVPIATNIKGVPITDPQSIAGVDDGVVLTNAVTAIVGAGQGLTVGGTNYRIDAGYSADTGQLLWGPVNRTVTPWSSEAIVLGEGKYAEYTEQTETWMMYDLHTGQKLWGPSEPLTSPWDYYSRGPSAIGYGNLYSWGLGGSVYCYNATTGVLQWTWSAGSAGFDTPYGTWPIGTFGGNYVLADGKMYVMVGHDYTPPVFKGAKIYCINATDGTEIWDSLSFNIAGGPALSDGYMVWDNGYDNQIYCYGQGPSRTTVDAPDIGVTTATPITITGTVTDISSGSQQDAVAMNFPNGLPAVSDASMSQFMEAVYQQQPMPHNVTGVPVTISVTDSNGNYRDIGTTTSNAYGTYSLNWTPDIPGNYEVTATFAGTGSYYPSSAATAFYASESAPTTAPTTPPSNNLATATDLLLYIAVAAIAIIIAIAIATVLILRKRP